MFLLLSDYTVDEVTDVSRHLGALDCIRVCYALDIEYVIFWFIL